MYTSYINTIDDELDIIMPITISKPMQTMINHNNHDHNDNHDKKQMHKCDYESCDKIFRDSRSLREHIWVHQGEKPYICYLETCGKKFSRISSLRKHERIHKGEKPYVCQICNQSFSQGCNLTRHLYTHQNVKQYQCEICYKDFLTSANLKQHKLIHSDKNDRQKFHCENCDKSYYYKNSLKKHIEESHTKATDKDHYVEIKPKVIKKVKNKKFVEDKGTNTMEIEYLAHSCRECDVLNIENKKIEKMTPHELHEYLHYHMHCHMYAAAAHNGQWNYVYQGEEDKRGYDSHLLETNEPNQIKYQNPLDLAHYSSDYEALHKLQKQALINYHQGMKPDISLQPEIQNNLTCYCNIPHQISSNKSMNHENFNYYFPGHFMSNDQGDYCGYHHHHHSQDNANAWNKEYPGYTSCQPGCKCEEGHNTSWKYDEYSSMMKPGVYHPSIGFNGCPPSVHCDEYLTMMNLNGYNPSMRCNGCPSSMQYNGYHPAMKCDLQGHSGYNAACCSLNKHENSSFEWQEIPKTRHNHNQDYGHLGEQHGEHDH